MLLHEPEEEPTHCSDVHRLIRQIPRELKRHTSVRVQPLASEAVTDTCVLFAGFMRETVGHSSAEHHIWSQRTSAGKKF